MHTYKGQTIVKNISEALTSAEMDYSDIPVEDAKENAVLNKINNSEFHCGDVKEVLSDKFYKEKEIFNVLGNLSAVLLFEKESSISNNPVSNLFLKSIRCFCSFFNSA